MKIHGLAPGLNYGQQAYEGLKAFRTPRNQIAIFRPSRNAARMSNSASFISIPPVPSDHFLRCVRLAVSYNAEFVPPYDTGAALYIRPLLFGSSPQLGLIPPEEFTFCVYVVPVGVYHGVHPVDALILEHFDRAAPEGTGSAKIGGNYAPVIPWSDRARNEGFGITLHLDSKTRSFIDEFSTSAFIGVKQVDDQYSLLVSDSKSVIKSVTADSVCRIAESWGYRVECRPVAYDELPAFSEVIAAGTAAALVPVKSIAMQSRHDRFVYGKGSDEPGPICIKLLHDLKNIQRGIVPDTFGWLDYVEQPETYLVRHRTNVDALP